MLSHTGKSWFFLSERGTSFILSLYDVHHFKPKRCESRLKPFIKFILSLVSGEFHFLLYSDRGCKEIAITLKESDRGWKQGAYDPFTFLPPFHSLFPDKIDIHYRQLLIKSFSVFNGFKIGEKFIKLSFETWHYIMQMFLIIC